MRGLVVAALVLTAGCIAGEPAPPVSEAGSDAPIESALPVAPTVDVRVEHSFLDEPESLPFEIPPDAGTLEVVIALVPEETQIGPIGCVVPDGKVVVRDPDSTAFVELDYGGVLAPGGSQCPGAERSNSGVLPAGSWVAEFTGRGTVRAIVTVSPA